MLSPHNISPDLYSWARKRREGRRDGENRNDGVVGMKETRGGEGADGGRGNLHCFCFTEHIINMMDPTITMEEWRDEVKR